MFRNNALLHHNVPTGPSAMLTKNFSTPTYIAIFELIIFECFAMFDYFWDYF